MSVEEGKTYLIYNHSFVYGIDQDINVSFAEAGANALTIVSSEPEQGAKLEKIDWETPVKVTLNKKVKYVHYEFSGDEGVQHEYYISEAEDGEDVLNVGPSKIDLGDRVLDNAWYMYEGSTYEIKIEAYTKEDAMYQGTETPEVATLTFEGATPRETKTAINILSVDPEPNIYSPTAEQCLSFKENRRTVTIEVDKEVKVKSVVVPMGMYGTKDWGAYDVNYENGHTVVTAVLDESNKYDANYKLTTDIILQITFTDMDGNEVVDGGEGKYGKNFFNSGYEFSFGVLDGRYADASLMYESTTPAADSYNPSLSQVELNYGSFVMLTSTASAALYKDDVKVADAKLSANTDENKIIAKFVEIGTDTPKEINEFGAYVLKVDSQSIANEYFDELMAKHNAPCFPLWKQVSMYSPPNRTYSSPSIRLSVVIVSLFLSMNLVITFLANCDCFSLSGNHEFLPCFFAFQILELADMYHFQIILSSTIFTFMGFQASHKACALHSIVTGHNVRIVNACFLVQPKPTMI